jgi:YebC/PmpR family DNA-binding regulatory protein
MAGHSHFANIQGRKGALDKVRGKIFTKIIREINVAVKKGGGPDPESNPRLRTTLAKARSVNMSKDTIERAIKKASGEGSENYEEITYEGYAPEGVGVFVECATDNNTRTVANIRAYFNKAGGNVGKEGCLEFVFNRKGVFILKSEGINEEDFTLEGIDAGADDVEFGEGMVRITCEMEQFGKMSKYLADKKLETIEAGLERVPVTFKKISEDTFQKLSKLLNSLEEDDDVQKVYHNAENFYDFKSS